jgi:hypothetical protein
MKTRASLLSPSSFRRLSLARRPPPSSRPPSARLHSTPRGPGAPLRLSAEEQRIFDELVRRASAPPPPTSPPKDAAGAPAAKPAAAAESAPGEQPLHPDARKGAAPEFAGDVNPKTGEVGGPKNEPLRWGAGGDWSFNGRATDF